MSHGARRLPLMASPYRPVVKSSWYTHVFTGLSQAMSPKIGGSCAFHWEKSGLMGSLQDVTKGSRAAYTSDAHSGIPGNNRDRTWKPTQAISFENPSTSTLDLCQNLHTAVPASPTDTLSAFNPTRNPEYPDLSLSESFHENGTVNPVPKSTSAAQGPENSHEGDSTPEGNASENAPPSDDEPFRTPLGFHIPQAKMKEALDAEPTSREACWQHTLYRGPEGENNRVAVHYCKNKEQAEKVAQYFVDEKVLGFDIEWKSPSKSKESIKENLSLAQIASEQRVALFHFGSYPNAKTADDFLTPSFKKIMESSEITKVGVSIMADCTRVNKYLNISCRGLFELSHLFKLVKYSTGDVKKINKTLVSLTNQVQEHLELPLWKGDVRTSDWSAPLSHEQTQYAASDSYAGFHLYHKLEAKRQELDPMPPCPSHAELKLPIKLAIGHKLVTDAEAPEVIEDSSEDMDSYSDISVDELTHDLSQLAFEDASLNESEDGPMHLTDSRTDPTSPTSTSKTSSSKAKPISLPPSAEIFQANDWVEQYHQSRESTASNRKNLARPAELRAYALWHEQDLDVPVIAGLLRQPPLQKSTVVNYIGKAVQFEKLPYKQERIKVLEQYGNVYGAPVVNWERLKKGGMIGIQMEDAANQGESGSYEDER